MAEQTIRVTSELTIGETFAGHRIDGILGRGGMGVVYRAMDLRLGRRVAMKVISPAYSADEDFRRRFERESQIAASITQPNVVTVFQAGDVDGVLYVTMQLVEGTDLKQLLVERRSLDVDTACNIVGQVAAALDAAHARGLVHRDVKPANILIAHEAPMRVYLSDFGLTKRASSQSGLTKTGSFVGTIDYASPEQIKGWPVDARSDVYALGCVLFQMLAGQAPFRRENEYATMYAHTSEPPPDLATVAPHVPPALGEVIRRALEKNPDHRFPSAGDLARAARAAVAGAAPSEPERSVAVGRAAPGAVTGDGSPYVPEPPQPLQATAAEMPGPVPDPRYGYGIDPHASYPTATLPRGRSPWPVVVVVLAVLVAGGGVAAALLLGGKSSHRTVVVRGHTTQGTGTGTGTGTGNSNAVRTGVSQIADLVTLSEQGRADSTSGNFPAAIANRQQVIDKLNALSLPPSLVRSQTLLRQALQASIAADQRLDSCGPGCAGADNARATGFKAAFVAEFNPLSERYLGRSFDQSQI